MHARLLTLTLYFCFHSLRTYGKSAQTETSSERHAINVYSIETRVRTLKGRTVKAMLDDVTRLSSLLGGIDHECGDRVYVSFLNEHARTI